jgi:ankyrin repeat protein
MHVRSIINGAYGTDLEMQAIQLGCLRGLGVVEDIAFDIYLLNPNPNYRNELISDLIYNNNSNKKGVIIRILYNKSHYDLLLVNQRDPQHMVAPEQDQLLHPTQIMRNYNLDEGIEASMKAWSAEQRNIASSSGASEEEREMAMAIQLSIESDIEYWSKYNPDKYTSEALKNSKKRTAVTTPNGKPIIHSHERIDESQREGTNTNDENFFSNSYLLEAIFRGDGAGVENMITHGGISTNEIPRGYEFSPLVLASKYGHDNIVETLIEHGADVNKVITFRDKGGKPSPKVSSPLSIAVESNRYTTTEILVRHGADINQTVDDIGTTLLMLAAILGHSEVADVLIQNGAGINDRRADGATPLYLAAECGNESICEFLLKNNAQPICTASEIGHNPLGIAAKGGHNNIVHLLIRAGVNVDLATGVGGLTPIMIAIEHGHVDTTLLLSDYKADWEKPNTIGQSAIDLLGAKCARECEEHQQSYRGNASQSSTANEEDKDIMEEDNTGKDYEETNKSKIDEIREYVKGITNEADKEESQNNPFKFQAIFTKWLRESRNPSKDRVTSQANCWLRTEPSSAKQAISQGIVNNEAYRRMFRSALNIDLVHRDIIRDCICGGKIDPKETHLKACPYYHLHSRHNHTVRLSGHLMEALKAMPQVAEYAVHEKDYINSELQGKLNKLLPKPTGDSTIEDDLNLNQMKEILRKANQSPRLDDSSSSSTSNNNTHVECPSSNNNISGSDMYAYKPSVKASSAGSRVDFVTLASHCRAMFDVSYVSGGGKSDEFDTEYHKILNPKLVARENVKNKKYRSKVMSNGFEFYPLIFSASGVPSANTKIILKNCQQKYLATLEHNGKNRNDRNSSVMNYFLNLISFQANYDNASAALLLPIKHQMKRPGGIHLWENSESLFFDRIEVDQVRRQNKFN